MEKTSRDDAWAAKSEERRLDDFQYEYFLSSLESTELQHLIYGEDWGSGSDVSFSLSERLAILKLPKEIFADTLEVLSTTNIEAYEAMMQQPLVSGQSGIRKKFSRKEKRERRERREKDSKDKEHLHSNKRRKKKNSSRHGQNDSPVHLESSATGKPDGLESNETWQEAKVFTESLAVVVAKAINEGTCGALLSALVLLQRIRRQRQLNPVSNGESHLLLPIANILAAYVEMQIDDRSGSESSKQFHNPFRHSLLSSKSMRLKSFSNSETSHNDGNSCYLDAMEVQSQDTASQSQDGGVCGPYSDAGSTIGSTVGSTFADVGTDGASNPGDIEASEDDLLAQALQMSAHDLMNLPPSASKSSLLNDGSKGLSDEASRSQNNNRNASLGSASSEAANDDRFPMESCAEEDIPIKQMPENLLPVLPMESLGPFYTSKFWKKVLEDTDTHNNSESSSSEVDGIDMGVSLDNTIVALLATLGICADKKMNISSGALYRTEDEESAKSTSNVSVAVAVTPLVPIVANKHVLALAEQLLSDLLVDIQLHLLKQDQFSRTSVCSDPLEGPYQSERADEIPEQDQQFDSLGDSSNSSFTDVFSDWQYNLYLQVWSANILLKVIQATVEEASEIKISVNSMGLALKDVMNDKWSTTSLGDRLKGTVSKFVGVFSGELNSFGNKGENNRILESGKSVDPNTKLDLLAFYPKRSAPLAVVMTNSAGSSQSNHFELPFAYSWTSLYHIVRCRAIDAYSMTFPFVLPSPIGRMHLLEQLLIQSADALEGRMTWVRDDNPSINRHFQWITEYCTSKELSPTGNVVYRLKNLPPSYYKLATVKRMIMVFAKNDACLQGFFSVITADGKRQLKRPRFDNLCRIDYEDDKLVVGDSNSETFTDRLARYSALETLLFPRIQQSVPSCDVSNRSSLQWGEFALLRSLQNFHIALHSKASLEWSANTYPVMRSLVFDANKCHPNLLLSEDCRVVRHCGPKLWASVVCDLRLSPQSGVYEVVVRIDKCAKGHVFLGVVTADMNTEKDSYVGVDRCGWGMIGTRSLWHNKTKVVVEYGAAFSTGSVIIISIDTDNAKISYRNLENDWGVAFENVASSNLFPAFSLHEKDDQVSLLTCRKVGCPRMASFLPVLKESQDSLVLYGRKLMATVLSLLDNLAQTQPSELRDSKIFLDHPLLGTFLPAFAAYFLSCRYCPVMIDALNFRLLPLFTRVCKQLVSIGESIESSLTDDVAHHRSSSAIGTYQPFGEWLIRSSAISGLNLPAQEYKLSLTSIDSEDDFDPAEGNKLCSTELGSLKTSGEGLGLVSGFLGKGVGTSTSVSLNGSQMGTRIRFLETWNMSNHSKIDARYSLCGKFFWGKFRDCKSGKLGCLDGSRTTEMNEGRDFVVRSVIQNCVGLCSSVVGKFAGLLLLADPSSVSIPSGGNDFDEQTER